MNIYVLGLKRYGWIILVCTALTTLTGLIIVKSHAQSYQASSTLLVSARPVGSSVTAIESAPDPLQSLAEANTYAAEIQSRSVLTSIYQAYPALAQQGVTLNALVSGVSASASTSAAIVTITAVAASASDTLLIANDVAQGFQAYVQGQFQASLNSVRNGLQDAESHYVRDKGSWESKMQVTRVTDPRYNIYATNRDQDVTSINAVRQQLMQLPTSISADVSVTQLATLADVASTTRANIMIVVTLGLGLLLGVLTMLLVIYLDDRLFTGEQVREKLGMAYLGGLCHHREITGPRSTMPVAIQRELADVYANLHLTGVLPYDPHSAKSAVLLVTSSQEAEGKTTVAAALALEVARNGGTVVVVDGNLARPSTHLAFSMHVAGPGLSGLLMAPAGGVAQIDTTALRCNVPGIWLLPAGAPMEEPAGMLEQKLPAILVQLRKKTDLVIIDGPPLLSGAEASIIATLVDSIAFVIDSRHSKLRTLQKAKALLGLQTSVPVGVIINHIPKGHNQYYAAAYPRSSSTQVKVVEERSIAGPGGVPARASSLSPSPAPPPTTASPPMLTTRFGGLTTPLRLPTYAPVARSASKSLLQRSSTRTHVDATSSEPS